jgi:anti-anti-sigma factor
MTDPAAWLQLRTDGGHVTLTVHGEVDLSNAGDLQRALEEAITNDITVATIDMSDVTYIDSIGMRLLFSLAARLKVAQIAFVLVAPVGSPARRVVELAGLASAVSLQPS